LFHKHSVFLPINHLSITRLTSLLVYSVYSAGRLTTLQPARHVPAIHYEVISIGFIQWRWYTAVINVECIKDT